MSAQEEKNEDWQEKQAGSDGRSIGDQRMSFANHEIRETQVSDGEQITSEQEKQVSGENQGIVEGQAAVFCVGNRLMLDDGIGPAVYDELLAEYDIPDNVTLCDVGCMSMDMIGYVDRCDFILTVDAVDNTGEPAGTVFRFNPDDMARHSGVMGSLHDLKLIDLFDAASLLGYVCEGRCLGMQVENRDPSEYVIGLTPPVADALPLLVETVVAELANRGYVLTKKQND